MNEGLQMFVPILSHQKVYFFIVTLQKFEVTVDEFHIILLQIMLIYLVFFYANLVSIRGWEFLD